MSDQPDGDIREVPCPGEHCPHPPGHVHLQAGDGRGQVWSADGKLLDLFDLSRPAALVPEIRQVPAVRWRGRSR